MPPEQQEAVLDFTHGHPPALTLVAELFNYNPALKCRAEAAPDIIWALLERFIAEVPSALHREVLAAYADFERLAEADFQVSQRRYGVYGHDWRAQALTTWLSLMAEREGAFLTAAEPAPPAARPVVLFKADFIQAVRQAFKDFHNRD